MSNDAVNSFLNLNQTEHKFLRTAAVWNFCIAHRNVFNTDNSVLIFLISSVYRIAIQKVYIQELVIRVYRSSCWRFNSSIFEICGFQSLRPPSFPPKRMKNKRPKQNNNELWSKLEQLQVVWPVKDVSGGFGPLKPCH